MRKPHGHQLTSPFITTAVATLATASATRGWRASPSLTSAMPRTRWCLWHLPRSCEEHLKERAPGPAVRARREGACRPETAAL